MTPGVVAGDPDALRRLDRLVHQRVLASPNPTKPEDSSIVRIKVWDTDGRIVYSDERALIGRHFALPEDLREAMDERKTSADVSDLERPREPLRARPGPARRGLPADPRRREPQDAPPRGLPPGAGHQRCRARGSCGPSCRSRWPC